MYKCRENVAVNDTLCLCKTLTCSFIFYTLFIYLFVRLFVRSFVCLFAYLFSYKEASNDSPYGAFRAACPCVIVKVKGKGAYSS